MSKTLVLEIHSAEAIENALLKMAQYMHQQAINNPNSIHQMADKYSKNANVLIAVTDGTVKGMSAFYSNDQITKTAFLSTIVVAKDAQRNGLGHRLLAETIQRCIADGMQRLRLEVADSNANAISFYKKHGFSLERKLDYSSYYILNTTHFGEKT